ncbi:BlaI/MecI/CopY family transcriptional regulator [bacterium]|nr:BlaI/MecI/CopY family transcriptional regulator [bacterium]
MGNTPSTQPTDGEFEILLVLWEKGPSTVRVINESLNKKRPESAKEIGYTTTLKLMQIMAEKGLLSRSKSGKTHIYKPEIDQSETQQRLVNKLMDKAFQGSAMKLVQQALGNRETSTQELDEIRKFLDELEEGKK